jgi:hypothetical protein
MSIKSRIAALAAVVTVIAAPAFAGDQDTATLLQDSGRYIGQVNQVTVPAGAYASAQKGVRAQAIHVPSQANDFQLQGR